MADITIYDPAMCCSTGVCGPGVDPELTRIASALHKLETKGIAVKRYNLANDPAAFIENDEVKKLLHSKGADALPFVFINGNFAAAGGYPANEELAEHFSLETGDLEQKKPKLTIDLKSI
ncbi:arsenite efflux transporter metallochaperone ArsD [Jeotgalibacillus sp. S-D1]|uniref:arsenite efflux transporter metallochaperone ArsD n=1 Tax=Jeotgalibacillus sp. S-D1 TaxID=2552189 RepID=UPI00105A84D9|nr:arsenite efflux transporter metallochaperone ArsD [Jeotgalibacillus sp. S-D1]TDL33047.1 arsenite efflux transporter metallochaperone ArsD [Jeotgalibacillus sp. S-D1]